MSQTHTEATGPPRHRRRRRPSRAALVRRWLAVGASLAALAGLAAWAAVAAGRPARPAADRTWGRSRPAPATTAPSMTRCPAAANPLPGMPPVADPCNVYVADGAGNLTGAALRATPLVYVPNGLSNSVTEIDPATNRVVREFPVGRLPQHVVPSWDLSTLWVTNDQGNSLTPIDPTTGLPGAPVPVEDPYNMYFTPDGRSAVVVAEAMGRLDFRDPHTMAVQRSLSVDCPGIDHMDFSADGRYLLASCEFSGQLIKVDVASQQVVGTVSLGSSKDMPQDVKLSPDGAVFYVADQRANGLWEVDGARLAVIGFLPTGAGAHGLYPSRDGKALYVSNRDAGSLSVVDFATRSVVATWQLPDEPGAHVGGPSHASPDMGGVSADGRVLWLSGRYDSDVYAIDTGTGHLLARVPVGDGPHGVCVWPQPGRYSLGHTGILR